MSNVDRYSVVGASPEQIHAVGGANLSVKPNLGIVFTHLTQQQVNKLLQTPGVTVTRVGNINTLVGVPTPVPASEGLSLSPEVMIQDAELDKFRNSWSPTPLLGYDINAAVVDTGVRTTHQSLGGKVVYSKNFSSSPNADDVFNHGTGVAHIIHAMAPETNILNLKVIGDDGAGSEEAVVDAIEWCINMKMSGHQYAPHLVNMSLGTPDSGDPNNAIRVACRIAHDQYDIWIVAAAGNDGPQSGTITCPATEQYVMAVGSCKTDWSVSDFSSRGPTKEGLVKPDLLMPGENILMASAVSDTATIAKSGTSFAAPFMVGVGAWFRQGVALYADQNIPASIVQQAPYFRIYKVDFSPNMVDVIDHYMPMGCFKPGDSPSDPNHLETKDDTYGYGTLFAPVAMEFLTTKAESSILSGATLNLEGIINLVMPIMVLGMMSSFVRSMYLGNKNKRVPKYT